MNPSQLKRYFPNASKAVLSANAQDYDHSLDPAGIPDTQPSQLPAALEEPGSAEAQGAECPLVRFTLFRVRLLDVDAKYGSVKDLLDGLQFAGLIHSDREGEVRLEVRQEKVAKFKDEKTEIEVIS